MQEDSNCGTLVSEFRPKLLMVIEDPLAPNVKKNTCTNWRRII